MQFAAPEIAEVLSVRKSFKSAAGSGGRQTLKRQFHTVSKQKKGLSTKIPNKPVGHVKTFSQKFLVNHVKQFSVSAFAAVSGKLVGKIALIDDVLSSHEQRIYPTTSFDKNCIEFAFQTNRNYYVDLRVLLGFEGEIRQRSHVRNLI